MNNIFQEVFFYRRFLTIGSIIASHRVSKGKILFSEEFATKKHLPCNDSVMFLNLNYPELYGAVVNAI